MDINTIAILLGCVATIIGIMTPILKLTTSITTLDVTMKNLIDNNNKIKEEQHENNKLVNCKLENHDNKINDCDKRIYTLENWKESL